MIYFVLILLSLFLVSESFIPTSKIYTQKNKLNMVNPLPGSDIGIPINIFQNVYTNLHYGYDISNFKNFILPFLIGYYTYGGDRYRDALEYIGKKYPTKKENLYNYIISNQDFVKSSLEITFGAILIILITDENFLINLPFIGLLISTDYYKLIKQKNGLIKPLYISSLWTACSVFLPCVLHDHNYSIINYPMDYIPCLLTIFSLSSILDLRDVDEDIENGVETFAVKFGKENTSMISLFLLSLSSLLFGLNEHYLDRPLVNSLNEIQNVGLALIPFLSSYNSTNLESKNDHTPDISQK